MNLGPEFLTIKDLWKWGNYSHYQSAARAHKRIREAIKPGKKYLTIEEFAEFVDIDYTQIYTLLRVNS